MRVLFLLFSLAVFGLVSSGCIMVIGVRDLPRDRHLVEIDGDLYLVDAKRERLRKLDRETIQRIQRSEETVEERSE